MHQINLQLSIDETNLLLKALGQMAYQDVFQLVDKIQQQAYAQVEQTPGEPEA